MRNRFDVVGFSTLSNLINDLVNMGIYKFILLALVTVIKIEFVHFIQEAVHIFAGKWFSKLKCEI